MKEKILIENGTIIDGTGSKEYIGNIVIEDNKIIDCFLYVHKFPTKHVP